MLVPPEPPRKRIIVRMAQATVETHRFVPQGADTLNSLVSPREKHIADNEGPHPHHQLFGLFFLVMAAGIAFLQAFALMISPLTTSNRLVFAAFRRAATFLQLWIVLAQAMAIITAGVLLSGVIVTWLSRL